ACLNVSNLLVARSAARRKEVAIRGALGGSRWKLVQEQMTESLLIAVVGRAVGWVLSMSATRWLATPWRDLPRADAIRVDGPVLAFSVAIVLETALVPAISSAGKSLLGALQDSARSIGGSVSRATLRKVLLSSEIALTVVLLISAGLLFRSFIHLRTSDLGCVTNNVLTVRFGLPE